MKQRISVQVIVRSKDKILLLRRVAGHPEVIGKYELPGGSIDEGEQPADAATRHLERAIGLVAQTVQLSDVVTLSDQVDGGVQHICVLYVVDIRQSKSKLIVSQTYDHFKWELIQNLQHDSLTDATQQLMNLIQQYHISSDSHPSINDDKKTTNNERFIIYSDGGSRGNPGPSAAGFVVMNESEQVIHEGGAYLGITTNNLAEYHGVQLGLEKALELGAKRVDFRIDSMLVVNQMNGIYTIKNRELWPIHERIQEMVMRFDKVTFTHVQREFNQLADGMVNKILNAHAKE